MRAWQVAALGEPADVMGAVEAPLPEVGPGHLRVRVLATALSPEHGLLRWTPIVALALAGLLALARGDARARVILVAWARFF